jgi:hypothetical protein
MPGAKCVKAARSEVKGARRDWEKSWNGNAMRNAGSVAVADDSGGVGVGVGVAIPQAATGSNCATYVMP